MDTHLKVINLSKVFSMHVLNGKQIVAFKDISFSLQRGQFLGIRGKSGGGKSSLIKCIYRNYDATSGDIYFYDEIGNVINLTTTSDMEMLSIRTHRMGYVSQFFQPIPRMTTMNVVIDPLIDKGWNKEQAVTRAKALFEWFDIPKNLWDAFPSTFSGGERQRINLMRTLIDCPELLLLDEPTASLDDHNRNIILNIIKELKKQRITMIGIFHNTDELGMLADEILPMERSDETDFRKVEAGKTVHTSFSFQARPLQSENGHKNKEIYFK